MGRLSLIEREDELVAIAKAVGRASGSDGALLIVEGPAGIGKSRLLDEARGLAGGMVVLTARGGELEHDVTYGVAR